MNVKAVPEGYHNLTPYAVVDGAGRLIEFLKTVFGAEETVRMEGPDGRIGHAEVRIGDSLMMLADSGPASAAFPAMVHVYVDDSDAAYERAMQAGATSLREPTLEFYGDRMAGVMDSFGNQYWMATHVEDVSEEEMARRAQELAQSQPG